MAEGPRYQSDNREKKRKRHANIHVGIWEEFRGFKFGLADHGIAMENWSNIALWHPG